MKIQFLTRALHYGGAERQLVEIAKALHGRGHTVLVTTYYPEGPLEKDLHTEGVPVATVQKRGRWDTVPFLMRLAKQILLERPDVLHGYLPVPNLLVTLCKPLLPGTLIVWGIRASNVEIGRHEWLSRMVFKAECLFSRFADIIIVNSDAGREHYRKHGVPAEKMVVIPNGIDTERFRPDPAAGERFRREWGVKDGEKLIGLVGRLDPMKDHPVFLNAAALLTKEREDIRFVCVGDGPAGYRSRLHALARDLGLERVMIWENGRDDMRAVYNALDIATSSSKFGEGFPNVIGEAMACGVPCVVTDVGDSARVVGGLGIVVNHSDPEDLKNGWLRCFDLGLEEWSPSIRRRVQTLFSTDRLVQNTLAALVPRAGTTEQGTPKALT